MKTKLMILGLLAGSSMFAATRFSIGVGIGAPAPVYTAPAYGYAAPAYGYNYGYTTPDYGYTTPSYGYTTPSYGYTYIAPRYDRDWDRDHYRRDDRWREHERYEHRRDRDDYRRDWRR